MDDARCIFCPSSKKRCKMCTGAVCAKHVHKENGCCQPCLTSIHEAARDGRCTTEAEDASIEAVGGPQSHLYGEITTLGFRALAAHVTLRAADRFVDLGSGLGRLCVQAVREYGVAGACGVEFAETRHQLALEGLTRETDDIQQRVCLAHGDCSAPALWQAGGPLSETTAIYAGSLFFGDELMSVLAERIAGCATVRVVATLKRFPVFPVGFQEADPILCETTWTAPETLADGQDLTPVFVYTRRT